MFYNIVPLGLSYIGIVLTKRLLDNYCTIKVKHFFIF